VEEPWGLSFGLSLSLLQACQRWCALETMKQSVRNIRKLGGMFCHFSNHSAILPILLGAYQDGVSGVLHKNRCGFCCFQSGRSFGIRFPSHSFARKSQKQTWGH
jgi:hypothetical protein